MIIYIAFILQNQIKALKAMCVNAGVTEDDVDSVTPKRMYDRVLGANRDGIVLNLSGEGIDIVKYLRQM